MKTQYEDGRLVEGCRFDVDSLEFLGWCDVEGDCRNLDGTPRVNMDGYSWHDYFDADGSYLGADLHGVEPVFAPFNHEDEGAA